jgi:hypothetical protein
MEASRLIHDKLITDFTALKFSDNSALLANVKKFYASETMKGRDGLIMPDSTGEVVEGQSAGNTQTTRSYSFKAIVIEEINATDSDSEGSIKYSRLLNVQDSILDYIQKEPSNLRAWGLTNNINIYKNRITNITFDQQLAEQGYIEVMTIRFTIFCNVVPQLL